MARKKVKLHYIENDAARKVTYKKRVKGLLKKSQELNCLCDVDVCTIVYGPYEEAPVVWPSSEAEANRIVGEYRRKPDIDLQSQRKLNQEGFLRQSLTKSEEKFLRLQRRNRETDMEITMSDLLCGRPVQQVQYNDMEDLVWVIEDKLRSVNHRLRLMQESNAPAAAAATATATAVPAAGISSLNLNSPFANEILGGNSGVPFAPQAGPYHQHQHQHLP